MRCVRPDLTTVRHWLALFASDSCSTSSAGIRWRTAASVAAMWVAVGKVSLELCDMFTSSLGCTVTPFGRGDGRDHLVGVHVRAGARTGLEDVDGELVVVQAVGDLTGGRDDRVGLLRRQQAEVLVHLRARALEQAECADLGALERPERDREVLHRALGLRAPQRVDRHPHFAHGVVLDAVSGFFCVIDSAVGGHLLPVSSVIGDVYGKG